jgi:hypothetical protein
VSPLIALSLEANVATELTLRVLYRCCTLADQSPLIPATFSFINPLLTQIVLKGGLEPLDNENALEQLTLVLNLLKSHVSERA